MGQSLGQARQMPMKITKDTIDSFMLQFDTLVSDCDGVVWTPSGTIPNVREGLESLRGAGKKLLFVTNNSVLEPKSKFERLGFSVQNNEIVHPALAISQHLVSTGFKKKAFVLSADNFKRYLRANGVSIIPESRTGGLLPEILPEVLGAIKTDDDVGAVIVDLDVNLNYIDLCNAISYLRHPECRFYAGATDAKVTFENGKVMLGPGPFLRTIEEISGRKAEVIGKPGTMMIDDYLKSTHKLDVQRTFFVGDSLEQDMGVAHACGMKKVLVLTGLTQLEDLKTCKPELIPDYYIPSIADFATLLKRTSLT